MRYERVCLESLGYSLPTEVVTSAELEERLRPLYERLRLPTGRLELMSGIGERRFWPVGTLPSQQSVVSGERAIEAAGFDRSRIGALVHGSVCRDHLEPATASTVHHRLGLGPGCVVYDVSNACLGVLNGILQVANMIELGQIEAGLVVGTENARPLVEATIESLNHDPTWTRQSVKRAVASLTIGSASCAALLVDRSLSRTGNRLTHAVVRADTRHHELCRSERDDAGGEMRPLMETDSESLLQAGVALGQQTFEAFLGEGRWTRESIARSFCHQVGTAHRRAMLELLGLDESRDFVTYPWLGNTGSAALPVTLAVGLQRGLVAPGDQTALLGIGSGVHCVMVGGEWRQPCVAGDPERLAGPHFARHDSPVSAARG